MELYKWFKDTILHFLFLELLILIVYAFWLLMGKLRFKGHTRTMLTVNFAVYILILIILYWLGGVP